MTTHNFLDLTREEISVLVERRVPVNYQSGVLDVLCSFVDHMQPLVRLGMKEGIIAGLLSAFVAELYRRKNPEPVRPAKANRKHKQKKKKQKPPKPPTEKQRWYGESYLRSSHWRDLRLRIIDARGGKCEKCGMYKSLVVHHLTYERLGGERDEDLQVLCKWCHDKIHEGGSKRRRKIL